MSIRINKVYTRSGDLGETSLVDGSKVKKTNIRCRSFGELDELNSCLGLVKEELDISKPEHNTLKEVVEYLQQELFDIGAEIATPNGFSYPTMWITNEKHVEHLELLCDHFNENLRELKSFILPGGSKLASYLHLARTVCRRGERVIAELFESEFNLPEEKCSNRNIFRYINRLSDLLFVLSRYVLEIENKTPPLWIREADRKRPVLK